jgi:hypothetical protein
MFAGEARNVYASFYNGDDSAKFRLICCPDCEQSVAEQFLGHALHRGTDGRWRDPDAEESLASIMSALTGSSDAIRWKKVS